MGLAEGEGRRGGGKVKKKCELVEEEKRGEEENKGGEDNKTEIKRSEYWPSKNYIDYAYDPEIFSDENPNACSVM